MPHACRRETGGERAAFVGSRNRKALPQPTVTGVHAKLSTRFRIDET
jgi:hypothetical protein